MNQVKSATSPMQRITVVDALRGFALLGVILIHMLDHFGYSLSGDAAEPRFPAADKIIQWLADKIIAGRFINIFSFLFGLSFFIQMDRASKKGIDFRGRFLWRMLLLFVIGVVGTCFTYLDILTIYAVFGMLLVFLFPLKNWVLTLLACLLLSGLPVMSLVGFGNIKTGVEQPAAESQLSLSEPLVGKNANVASSAGDQQAVNPSVFDSVKENLTSKTLDKLRYQFGLSSRGYMTLALFIIGFLVGRIRFFEKVNVKRKRNLALLAGFFGAAIVLELGGHLISPKEPVNLLRHIAEGSQVPLSAIVASALSDLSLLMQSGILAMGFIVLYQTAGVGKYLDLLSSYGRMGLTNYEMQGVFGAVLFSAWGFAPAFGKMGFTELFAIGLFFYILQVIASRYWLKHFLYGPLEWLWRSSTYLKRQPFKRK